MKPVWLGEWLSGQITREQPTSLQRQLYDALRSGIAERKLAPGVRLPSTRTLAQELGLSRNTLLVVFEQLQAQGYLESRRGSGCFVARVLPSSVIGKTSATANLGATDAALSQRCQEWLQTTTFAPTRNAGAFAPAIADLRAFPFEQWWRLVHKHQRNLPWQRLEYGSNGGSPALKLALTNYLSVTRNVHCEPEQIIITSSAQSALDLCCRVLADNGDGFALEEPGYIGARAAAIAAGLSIFPIAVDEQGIQIEPLNRIKPKLIYTTPSHQFPNCGVMRLPRRRALLQYAAQRGSYIIEDDYDAEIRFESKPLPSLQGQDSHGRVLYLGTFSKILYPALRLAYLVVPPGLVDAFVRSQNRLQRAADLTYQAALAEFIDSGKFARHIQKMRVIYGERNRYLQQLLTPHLKPHWTLLGGDAGLHFVLQSKQRIDDVALAKAAFAKELTVWPLSPFYHGDKRQYGLIMGYAAADKRELKRGYAELKRMLNWT